MESSDGVLVFAGMYSNRFDTINIKLLGTNVLVPHSPIGWDIAGLYCTQINILGPGSLLVGGFPGITLEYVQELTIQEGASVRFPQPTATGFEYVGIASHYERTPVRIDSSTFICETGIPFNNIADLQLSRCHVSVPGNAYFDEPTGTMLNANGIAVNGYFEIVPGSGTAISQYSDENSVTLYPNPAKEFVNVKCTMNDGQWNGATLEVFDVYGKRLQTVRVSSEITPLDVSGLADGMYFVRVKKEADIVSKPFVKK
ncbi:MAG: T9SS type A sorting domain-containing protein [Bacteroidales bacterium]|nr:T9SS type A sorting domain-containing protein [Bacteroidales bacterium]